MNRKTKSAAREALLEIIKVECLRRQALYRDMTPLPTDKPEVRQAKIEFLFLKLQKWAEDPVEWARDVGWAADPKGRFGGKGKLGTLAPPMMVPLIPSPAQADLLWALEGMLEKDMPLHVNLLKARQVAATTFVLNALDRWFRFKPGFSAALSSYEEEVIDKGGSGHRDLSGLFPRFRMLSDAVCWGLPQLRYNLHRSDQKWLENRSTSNPSLFDDSEDTKMKFVRPLWTVYQKEIFPEAKGNVITGAVPGQKFKQSDIMSFVLLDEYGLYNTKEAGTDRVTRRSCLAACDHVLTQGTIPAKGGVESDFKALSEKGTSPTLINITLDWSDVFAYMLLAVFKCETCGALARYHKKGEIPEQMPGPGPDGIERQCDSCGQVTVVRRFTAASIPRHYGEWQEALQPGELTSPWWNDIMDSYSHDRTDISRFYLRNWVGATTDKAFFTFDRSRAIRKRNLRRADHWYVIHSYDPGWGETNPACYTKWVFSGRKMIPRLVAWHQAAEKPIEWFVPFFKGWSSSTLRRQIIMGGGNAEKPWMDVHHYSAEELAMIDYAALFRPTMADRFVGDKYGSHKSGQTGESEYDVLARYRVDVDYEYSSDREILIQRFRDNWCPRLEIDPVAEAYRPLSPRNEMYPSPCDCLDTARMRTTKGQAEVTRDIDKNSPLHVAHFIDCGLYMTRELPTEMVARAGPEGEVALVPESAEQEHVEFGDGSMGF